MTETIDQPLTKIPKIGEALKTIVNAKSLVTVLNRPPVDSPETAVRAYIASRK